MRVKSTEFTCWHIVLLSSFTKSCLLNWPHWRKSSIRASSVSSTVHQTLFPSILSAILLYYWNWDKINDWGWDLGLDDLSMLGSNAAFCWQLTIWGRGGEKETNLISMCTTQSMNIHDTFISATESSLLLSRQIWHSSNLTSVVRLNMQTPTQLKRCSCLSLKSIWCWEWGTPWVTGVVLDW